MSEESGALDVASGRPVKVADSVMGETISGIVGGGVTEVARYDATPLPSRDGVVSGEEPTRVRRLGFCDARDRLDEGV